MTGNPSLLNGTIHLPISSFFFASFIMSHRFQSNGSWPAGRVGIGSSNVLQNTRTMRRSNERLEALLNQIQTDESRSLYPRLIFFEALSGFKDKPLSRERTTDTVCNIRRDFLDSFAYLCDVQKGGSTVTASALQKSSGRVYLWLAANQGIRQDVLTYANNMLHCLQQVTTENLDATTNTIFLLALEMSRPRISVYKTEVQKYATTCRTRLKSRLQTNIGTRLLAHHCSLNSRQ
jgi:hypothetical protein